MTDELKEKSFDDLLDDLFGTGKVVVASLYQLSDITSAQLEQVKGRWDQADEERQRVIMRHLADISEGNFAVDFLPVFVFGLGSDSAAVRIAALDGLWDATDEKLIDPIIELLQTDPNVSVQAGAAAALAHYVLLAEWGQIRKTAVTPAVEALLAVYQQPTSPVYLKSAALEALGGSSDPRVPDLIDEAYELGEADLQRSALFAMGSSSDERWRSILLEELENPVLEMRAEAARALGHVGDQEDVAPLADLLDDEESDVVQAVIVALGLLGGEEAGNLLQQLAENPGFEEFYDLIDETLEELDWLSGEFDLIDLADPADEFEEPLL